MSKQTINLGTEPNDGLGDPLRVAMDKCNDNFNEIYAAGPVSSNIQIANNSIVSTVENSDISITANGTGRLLLGDPDKVSITGGSNGYVLSTDGDGNLSWKVDEPGPNLANVTVNVIPSANATYNLGSSARQWASLYATGIDISGTASFGEITGPVAVNGNLSASGNVDGTNVNITNRLYFSDSSYQTTAYPGTLFTLSLFGNITGGNLISSNAVIATTGVTGATVTATGNVTGGNLVTGGAIIASGNITGDVITATTFSGNGSALTGVLANPAGANTQIQFNDDGFLGASSSMTWDGSEFYVDGTANVTGSVSAATIDVSGNIIAGNISATTFSGSLDTATQANITSVGTLTSLSVTGNIAGGNISTSGDAGVTGNITGGNLISAGDVSSDTATVTGNITGGNLSTSGTVVATGNISGGNLVLTYGTPVISFPDGTNQVTAYPGTFGLLQMIGNIQGGNVRGVNGISTGGNANITGNLNVTGTGNISSILYTMGNVTHWTANVTTVGEALDQLAARIYAIENP